MFGGEASHHNDPFEEEAPARDLTDPLLDPPGGPPSDEEPGLSPSSSLEEFASSPLEDTPARLYRSTSLDTVYKTESRSASANYHSDTEAHKMLDEMHFFREKKFFCDVTLVVGQKEIEAHRIVLSSCSPYFRAMFTSDLAESRQEKVQLYDVDPDAIQNLIDYAYTNKITICEENVQALLPAARMLQLDYVVEQCGAFLEEHLSTNNCLGFYLFADKHNCEQLLNTSRLFIQRNFESVVAKGEEFLQLQPPHIIEFLSMDKLNVNNEQTVFEAVMNWYHHAEGAREEHLAEVLRFVKLPLLPSSYLLNNVHEELTDIQDLKVKDLLIQAMKYHMLPVHRASMQRFGTLPRHKPDQVETMLAIGGGSQFTTHCECECYSLSEEKWYRVAPMGTPRARAGVVAVNGLVYSTGGYDGAGHLRTMERYNPGVDKWEPLPSMSVRRSCVGVAELDGVMYALGGYDGACCLDNMEKYDPLMEIWVSAAAMTTKRRYVRAVTCDKQIYAVGGFDGNSHLNTVEMYHPERDKWYSINKMASQRSGAGVISLERSLYVVGGNDGCTSLSSVERFDTREGKWSLLEPMHTSRSAVDIAVLGGSMYAVGGNDGCSSLNTVEKFDLVAGGWVAVSSMSMRRSSVGVCIVDMPSSVLETVMSARRVRHPS